MPPQTLNTLKLNVHIMNPPITDSDHLRNLLMDIRLESLTSIRDLEPEDQLYSSLIYISDLSTSAIEYIEKQYI